MKKKYIMVLIVALAVSIPVGCSRESGENIVLGSDKIIIDEDTKESNKEYFQIEKITETEPIDPGTIYWIMGVKENAVQLIYNYETNVIREVRIGRLDNNNKLNWTSNYVEWGIYTDYSYYGLYATKIKVEDKVYTVDNNGELEELVAYTKLINEQGNVLDRHDSYRNGTIDVAQFGNEEYPSLAIIDIPQEKYYVVPNELRFNEEIGSLNQILGIDGDKIFVNYQFVQGDKFDIANKNVKNTIGYIEDNKFTKILSEDDGTKIDTRGEMLYENGRILFSGLAEGKNGIWNYNIENKKLTKLVDVDSETFFEFYFNEGKDKVVISSLKPALEKGEKKNNTLSIADINDKLELSNITNIVTNTEERHHKAFAGWSNNGNTFYVRSTIADENYNATNTLEIYNVIDKRKK